MNNGASDVDEDCSEDTAANEPSGAAETVAERSSQPKPRSAVENDPPRRRCRWRHALAYGVLPAIALVLTMCAGVLKWQGSVSHEYQVAQIESVRSAVDGTIALLSYSPDTVEQQLGSARNALTGSFGDSYTSLVHDVVIPGAKQKRISAKATVPGAASVTATRTHAVVLAFVNQTIVMGDGAPTSTNSSVRVTLDRIEGRWMISAFDPV